MSANDAVVRYVTIANIDERGEASFEVATGLVREGCTFTTVEASFNLSPQATRELSAALWAACPPKTVEELRAAKKTLFGFSAVLHLPDDGLNTPAVAAVGAVVVVNGDRTTDP